MHFGLLNLNKPAGLTSRQVVNRVVRIVKPAKAGHAGTLDPLATGVLVVCVGPATKLISFVQQQPKTYRAEFQFGARSDTDDSTGQVEVISDAQPCGRRDVVAALQRFVGDISQVPPAFSAVHVDGKRAYDLARRGEQFELKAKTVTVHRIDVESFSWPHCTLEIECGSGTYIRSIARDAGEVLGVGGLMTKLERTAIGPFPIASAISPDDLSEESLSKVLIDAGVAVAHLPRYEADAAECRRLTLGQSIPTTNLPKTHAGKQWAVFNSDQRLQALAEHDVHNQLLRPRTVFPATA